MEESVNTLRYASRAYGSLFCHKGDVIQLHVWLAEKQGWPTLLEIALGWQGRLLQPSQSAFLQSQGSAPALQAHTNVTGPGEASGLSS